MAHGSWKVFLERRLACVIAVVEVWEREAAPAEVKVVEDGDRIRQVTSPVQIDVPTLTRFRDQGILVVEHDGVGASKKEPVEEVERVTEVALAVPARVPVLDQTVGYQVESLSGCFCREGEGEEENRGDPRHVVACREHDGCPFVSSWKIKTLSNTSKQAPPPGSRAKNQNSRK